MSGISPDPRRPDDILEIHRRHCARDRNSARMRTMGCLLAVVLGIVGAGVGFMLTQKGPPSPHNITGYVGILCGGPLGALLGLLLGIVIGMGFRK